MPCQQSRPLPHPLSIFSLIPLNDRAEAVINHSDNRHLVSFVAGAENPRRPQEVARGLNIGFHIASKSSYTLATIGRTGDIIVEGSTISRIQCSFEIHRETEEIFLLDRSSSWSTQTFGLNAAPFELERPDRRVVIARDVNDQMGFGGAASNLFQFKIHWHAPLSNFQEQISSREDHPRFTRTVDDETTTAMPSKPATRLHTPVVRTPSAQNQVRMMRYYKKTLLGMGSFGEVWKAVDVDSGEFLALKLVKTAELSCQPQYAILKREVEILARLSHPNILEFVSAQKSEERLEIFTKLKEGNIEDLINKDLFAKDLKLSASLFHQMLQALDYLDSKGIVHRDVKPENILYTSLANGYNFQLADFGLCNLIVDARTYAGSPLYMAPEIIKEYSQTSKVDVWSLFVTQAWAMDVGGFREKLLKPGDRLTVKEVHEAVQVAANLPIFCALGDMVIVDPNKRASAAEMLDKLFKGEGRTTPRNRILDKAPKAGEGATPQIQQTKQSRTTKDVGQKRRTRMLDKGQLKAPTIAPPPKLGNRATRYRGFEERS